MTQLIDPSKFTETVGLLRSFFLEKGFLEVHTQNRLSILAACEDPFNVATYNYAGQVWPLPQTGQMWLEHELLSQPAAKGFFCVSTSYRQEPNAIPGRHDIIFPMFEFEMPGNVDDLKAMEYELCKYLGFGNITEKTYAEWQQHFGLGADVEMEAEHELKREQEVGQTLITGRAECRPDLTCPPGPSAGENSFGRSLPYAPITVGALCVEMFCPMRSRTPWLHPQPQFPVRRTARGL